MRFEGFTKRVGKFWHAEVPILGLATQGKSQENAHEMIADAIAEAIHEKGFRAEVIPGEGDAFTVRSNQPRVFLAFMLKQQRAIAGLTLAEVAKRLKVNSTNAYSRYENGQSDPTMEKLTELLKAIDPSKDPVLKIA